MIALDQSVLEPTRILIVEDHPAVRLGLRDFLTALEGTVVSGEADDMLPALQAVREIQPDLVLLDIRLPGGNGLDLIKPMLQEKPELKIVMVSASEDRTTIMRAFQEGARGYITKQNAATALLAGLREVIGGDVYLCPPFARDRVLQAMTGASDELVTAIKTLSVREFQIFREMGDSCTNGEIAAHLGLSIKTINTHAWHLKVKLRVPDHLALRRLAADCARALPMDRLARFAEARQAPHGTDGERFAWSPTSSPKNKR